ncbi:DUF4331 family protein [Streptomyces sp. C184]|uniref:DUF4331 family protein n=1 Tax=Streptomyces sp. C184 TaxID=3237121 RepID=UPI0034C6DB58
MATGDEARSAEAVGQKVITDAEVSFGTMANRVTAGAYTFFAGSRSDAFFFDFDGIKNLFDTTGGRNFTAPHLGGKSPWTGVDSNTEANVFSMVVELPTSELRANPEIRIWGRCSLRKDGRLVHAFRRWRPPDLERDRKSAFSAESGRTAPAVNGPSKRRLTGKAQIRRLFAGLRKKPGFFAAQLTNRSSSAGGTRTTPLRGCVRAGPSPPVKVEGLTVQTTGPGGGVTGPQRPSRVTP